MAATDAGAVTAGTNNPLMASPGQLRPLAIDSPVPALRDDLQVQPGPRDYEGRHTWTLYDPLRNRFFQLDERAFHLVCNWGAGTPAAIAEAVAHSFPWRPVLEDIQQFYEFLANFELLRVHDEAMRKRLLFVDQARKTTLWQKLVHNYLFFRIPLLRPDRLLDMLYPRVRFLLSRQFLVFSALVGILSLLLILRQWQTFTGGLSWFFTAEGAAVFFLTLAFVKIFHEFGHALACRNYGVKVASMGVSFIVMWPILYTDATDGWRLTSRHRRAVISSAGVITELVLACYALAFWLVLPEGMARSVAFTVATTTIVMSLAVNLNPLMRFDGYFFLSDMLNLPNLQERAFALARWRMRRWLFGVDVAAPEHFPPRLGAILNFYAFSTWIYRFFLFIGIAFLVYHFFFKALGVLLFMVEIWYFIARPIRNEMRHWGAHWKAMDARRRRRWYTLGGAALLLLLFPWRQDVVAQAQMVDQRYERIFPVRPARVETLLVKQGQLVKKGDRLVLLSSPEVDKSLEVARHEVQRMHSLLDRRMTDAELATDRLVLQQELVRAESQLAGLERVHEQLIVVAPVSGRVEDVMPDMHRGRWVSPRQQLLTVREGRGVSIVAMLTEQALTRIDPSSEALFYGQGTGTPQRIPLHILAIEHSAVLTLDTPYFALPFGGEVPVSRKGAGGDQWVPDLSVYRVHLAPSEALAVDALPSQRLRGWVHIEGERRTLLGTAFRLVMGTVVREAGF